MLAEFREIDSYLTDSEDDFDCEDEPNKLPSLAQTELDNSVLRMGRALLAAAKENPVPGTTDIPAVTLRLTRLEPSPRDQKEHDPRIAQTVDDLCAIGIDVQLGERDDRLLSDPPDDTTHHTRPVHTTRRINLDLSILVALVSDLTHAPLPSSIEDAEARFTPSSEYVEWKKKRLASIRNGGGTQADGDTTHLDVDYVVRPSRALVTQVLEEMRKGLLEDISERLVAISDHFSSTSPLSSLAVEFWTTPEAKDRCLQIVSKIGGPMERQRAEAMFSDSLSFAEETYWKGSRYPFRHVPLLPIRLLPPGLPDDSSFPPPQTDVSQPMPPFFRALARTCRDILRFDTMPHPRSTSSPDDGELGLDDPNEIQRPIVARANSRLTAHTVQSLLWGAVRGWTTLTANKTSIKAIFKEMKASRNGVLWDKSDIEIDPTKESPSDTSNFDTAAIWMVDPRSLAEGMRADFGSQ